MPDSIAAPINFPVQAPGLAPLLFALAGAWRWLALATLAGAVLMSLALHVIPPQFTATMVVGPTGRSGPASMGPRTPALAPAAGRNIAEPGAADELLSDFARYLALLSSVPVAEKLVGDTEIMREIFRTAWDEEAGQWRPPTGLVPRLGRGLRWLAIRHGRRRMQPILPAILNASSPSNRFPAGRCVGWSTAMKGGISPCCC